MSRLKSQSANVIAFEAVMRTGSLSGAARDLTLSQPTVRRMIETLEAGLGDRLFTRADNGLIPTQKAHALLPSARALVESTYAFYRAASANGEMVAGRVRISASRVMAQYVLPPILESMRARNPGLQLELVPDDHPSDLLRRDADIAVRHVAPKQVQLVSKKLPGIELGLFTRDARVDADVETCLNTQPFVWEDRNTMLSSAAQTLGLPQPAHVAAATDDQALQVALIAAGVGMGICQAPLADSLGLHRAAPGWRTELPVWVVAHEDQVDSPPVRHCFDALVSGLGAP